VGFGMPIVYRPVSLHVHMDVRPFTAWTARRILFICGIK
jgi:hypothetical protein